MFESCVGVKFKGVEERSGEKNGRPWQMKEVVLFVQDFGTVKLPVHEKNGAVEFPPVDTIGKIKLSVSTGKFNSLILVWDHNSVFTPVTANNLKAAA